MARGALFVLVAACTGDKDPGDTDATGSTGETGEPVPLEPTFTRVRAEVLPSCALSGCHRTAESGNGLVLAKGQEYEALVNAPAEFAPGEVYVIPGDPDGSYVVKKITGAPGIVDDPMPPPLGNLDPRLLQLLREWIGAGALDN